MPLSIHAALISANASWPEIRITIQFGATTDNPRCLLDRISIKEVPRKQLNSSVVRGETAGHLVERELPMRWNTVRVCPCLICEKTTRLPVRVMTYYEVRSDGGETIFLPLV